MIRYKLDVDDAIVYVWQRESGYWNYSVANKDGSGQEQNWYPTEQRAKTEAKEVYNGRNFIYAQNTRTKYTRLKRAKWIKENI